MTARLDGLQYALPPELVAQEPVEPRDASRLLVCRGAAPGPAGRRAQHLALEDRRFGDLADLLKPGDVLVRNDTRVLAARAFFRRPTGGRLEVLFLQAAGPSESLPDAAQAVVGADGPHAERGGPGAVWEVLVRGRPRLGETLTSVADGSWRLHVEAGFGDGRWVVSSEAALPVEHLLERHGEMPLPPYIHRRLEDPERYQTTYAARPGSAAAPTAGLHFTQRLDRRLLDAGVRIAELTLHVGLGTFRPLSEETLAAGRLHAERFAVPAAVWEQVVTARDRGQRVVAVGTTVVRALEHLASAAGECVSRPAGETVASRRRGHHEHRVLAGSTDLLITPGFRFRVVDALVTNFHLPGSSLLALVMAFCGESDARAIYRHAVSQRYRFYSLGDAMLALP